jgi:hypothetical protein
MKETVMDAGMREIIKTRSGTSDVSLNGQALFVPQEDPPAFAPRIGQS